MGSRTDRDSVHGGTKTRRFPGKAEPGGGGGEFPLPIRMDCFMGRGPESTCGRVRAGGEGGALGWSQESLGPCPSLGLLCCVM